MTEQFDPEKIYIIHQKDSIGGFKELSAAYIKYRSEMDNNSLSDLSMIGPDPACACFYVMRKKEVIAFMIYGYCTDDSYFIYHGWVHPDHRKKGVYDGLWRSIIARAKEKKVPYIKSGTHINNLDMQSVCEKQGRVKTSIMYEFTVTHE